MSKIDQLRRQREEQHARQQDQTAAPKTTSRAKVPPPAEPEGSVAVEVVAAAAPRPAKSAKPGSDATEGACSVCGKTRPLANGMVSNHQKGFGKMCPGSRREPA